MMQHYLTLKEQNPDAILFYRLGDFYEMFFEDAKTASRELDLVLTGRAAGNNEKAPMCGIPYHACDSYIQRLIRKGYKVAICEQLLDPAASKGLVDRDIIKIVTPGTYMEETSSRQEQYLAAVSADGWNLCTLYCEIATGELFYDISEKSLVSLQKGLEEKNVPEAVLDRKLPKNWKTALMAQGNVLLSETTPRPLEEADKALIPPEPALLSHTLALLLTYLEDTQKQKVRHFTPARPLHEKQTMILDQDTRKHLELLKSTSSAAKAQSLWEFMDLCKTSMGSRMLGRWLEQPLIDPTHIRQRQDAVEYLCDQFLLRENLSEHLNSIYDLDRLASRIAYGNASPRDVLQLSVSLGHLRPLFDYASAIPSYPQWKDTPDCQTLYNEIKDAIVEEPPLTMKDGGIFKTGYDSQLDALRQLSEQGNNFILELEQKERERTGIKNLKIGYNRVFGYYIEVRKTSVPGIKEEYGYQTRQTLANAVRYTTDELKEKEEEILSANERKIELEQQLFTRLLERIRQDLYDIHGAAHTAASIDALLSLAQLAVKHGYVRPAFHEGRKVEIIEGRHPILETRMDHYISNDWVMDDDCDVQIITGPNMGGKSTYMRQNALLVIMAQAGSFIPARKADLPVFDRIFTRMGAGDDLLTGTSTFMSEMLEANNALRYATRNSLILFDEIGRGTATYDGMALAQAILEYIESAIHARTLFSTHYHELTSLDETNPGIENIHVDVKEKKGQVEFRYRMIPGKADKSYGINVAKLAKLPAVVTRRASDLLHELEAGTSQTDWQPNLFVMDNVQPAKSKLLERLDALDLDDLSPRQALECLYELKKLRQEVED